uniref:Uncharacterized protein n=1 Tax=Ananas comosus var. bracteatus TaxID=296719 RepID=A0A6V7QYI5_ANACO
MDESWQVPIGSILPAAAPPRSPAPAAASPAAAAAAAAPPPPPRPRRLPRRLRGAAADAAPPAILRRSPAPPATSIYDEIFRPAAERGGGRRGGWPEKAGEGGTGEEAPGVSDPGERGKLRTEEGSYDDIFGSDGGGGGEWRRRTRSRSRSKRSSAVSSDELSPPSAAAAPGEDDAVLSFFASKLRPITISSWRHEASPPSTISVGDQSSVRSFTIPFANRKENNYTASTSSSRFNQQQLRPSSVNFRCFSPPETIRRTPWGGNSELDSPPSVISSVSVDPVMPSKSAATEIEKVAVMEMDCDEDSSNTIPAESSFFIEIDAHGRRKEATEVDEAIAWAKETFWNEMHKKVKVENDLMLKNNEESSAVGSIHCILRLQKAFQKQFVICQKSDTKIT